MIPRMVGVLRCAGGCRFRATQRQFCVLVWARNKVFRPLDSEVTPWLAKPSSSIAIGAGVETITMCVGGGQGFATLFETG